VVRLRRSVPKGQGWTRRRRGSGWIYLDQRGERITDPEAVARLTDLVVPPAWKDVWLSPYPNGHIQAVGTDAAGRRQYLYHQAWTDQQAQRKHAHVTEFGTKLFPARRTVQEHLDDTTLSRERVLGVAFRMLDLGLFRIGGESYAEENGSFGLATLRKSHVRIEPGAASFDYIAKSGKQRRLVLRDPDVAEVLGVLKRRRGGSDELLAWKTRSGWRDLVTDDVNQYVKEVVMPSATAKDFRTWHATVLAAVALSSVDPPTSPTATRRAISQAVKRVSEYLGNTPSVCRASYIDPRVIDGFEHGTTLRLRRIVHTVPSEAGEGEVPVLDERVERAVLKLLRD
jgi:DNA topoisomerase I